MYLAREDAVVGDDCMSVKHSYFGGACIWGLFTTHKLKFIGLWKLPSGRAKLVHNHSQLTTNEQKCLRFDEKQSLFAI